MIVYVLSYSPYDAHMQSTLFGIYYTYKKALQVRGSMECPEEYIIEDIEVQE